VVCDAGKNFGEPSLRIDAVDFGGELIEMLMEIAE
jgi:hypothetical protein